MNFERYKRIKRFNTEEVEGITLGKSYIFPKIDGTNGSVWLDGTIVKAGSRNRELTFDNDNAGFYKYIWENEPICAYLGDNPTHRLFGEWLVKHTLKTYKKDAWYKFYVFDIMVNNEYVNYDTYKEWLDEYNIEYIPAICSIKNAGEDRLLYQLNNNTYLIEDGKGLGEGIVIKNYDYVNKFGETEFAKIVRNDFKADLSKAQGHPEINEKECVEVKIAEKYVTLALVEKVKAKIILDEGGWRSEYIPRLLQTVYFDIVNEEAWNFVKEFKNPTINFKALQNFIIHEIKQVKSEIFY